MLASLLLDLLAQQSPAHAPIRVQSAEESGVGRKSVGPAAGEYRVRAAAPNWDSIGTLMVVHAIDAVTGAPVEGAELRWCASFELLGSANRVQLGAQEFTRQHLEAVASLPSVGRTNAAGQASIPVPTSGGLLFAGEGERLAIRAARHPGQLASPLELPLFRFDPVVLEVRNSTGEPVAGLPIRTRQKAAWWKPLAFVEFTNEHGRAELSVPQPWWLDSDPVIAQVAGLGYPEVLLANRAAELRLTVESPTTASFRAQLGVDDSHFSMRKMQKNAWLTWTPGESGSVDVWPVAPEGRRALKAFGLPGGGSSGITVLWTSGAPGTVTHEVVEALQSAPRIRLRALDAAGKPLQSHRLWLHHDQALWDERSHSKQDPYWLDSTYPNEHARLAARRNEVREGDELWFATDAEGYVDFPIAEDWMHATRLGILGVFDGRPESAPRGAQVQVAGPFVSEITDVGDVRLMPFSLIAEGTVVDHLGRALADIPFEIRERHSTSATQYLPATDDLRRNTFRRRALREDRFQSLRTDDQGRFRFEGYPRGDPVQVAVGFTRRWPTRPELRGAPMVLNGIPEGTSGLVVELSPPCK